MLAALVVFLLGILPSLTLAMGSASTNATRWLQVRQNSSRRCPKRGLHIIAAPGYGGTTTEDYGYLATLVLSIQNKIPGSNNFCLGPYGPPGTTKDATPFYAEKQFRAHLRSFRKRCPKKKIAVVGYSAGAIGEMNAMCGPTDVGPTVSFKNIVAFVTYGDETYSAPRPYNKGTCHADSPQPRPSVSGCKGFFNQMQAYCDKKDGQCCAGGSLDPNAHFVYPKYDGVASNFVRRQYKKHKKHKKGKKHHGKHNN